MKKIGRLLMFFIRKRQSIIVKNEKKEIILFTKGADSEIEKRLRGKPE